MINNTSELLAAQATRKVQNLIERALYLSISYRLGYMPDSKKIAKHAQHIIHGEGSDRWDEYQWKGKPLFKLRHTEEGTTFKWAVEFLTETGQPWDPGKPESQQDTS